MPSRLHTFNGRHSRRKMIWRRDRIFYVYSSAFQLLSALIWRRTRESRKGVAQNCCIHWLLPDHTCCDIDQSLVRVRVRHYGRKFLSEATCIMLGDATLISPAARPPGDCILADYISYNSTSSVRLLFDRAILFTPPYLDNTRNHALQHPSSLHGCICKLELGSTTANQSTEGRRLSCAFTIGP